MPELIRGNHHLTFCVGPAQEDYSDRAYPEKTIARLRSTTSTTETAREIRGRS